jgi:hypothetical protein
MRFIEKIRNTKLLNIPHNRIREFLTVKEDSPKIYNTLEDDTTIFLDLPVRSGDSFYYYTQRPFGKFVPYSDMYPSERYYYWDYLSNPFDYRGNNKEYLTSLLYSLEKATKKENFEHAYDVVRDLIQANDKNKEFKKVASSMLVRASIYYQRLDLLQDVWDDIIIDDYSIVPFDLYVYATAFQREWLFASELVFYRKWFLDSCDNNYSEALNGDEYDKKLFDSALDKCIEKYMGVTCIEAEVLMAEASNVPVDNYPIFVNPSLSSICLHIPRISQSPMFRQTMQLAFDEAMEEWRAEKQKELEKAQEDERKIKTAGLKKGEKTYTRFGIEITENEERFYQELLKAYNGIIDTNEIRIEQGYLHLWFMHQHNTLGGIKLRGRVFKIYNPFLNQPRNISGVDEAIYELKNWACYTQQKIKAGEYYHERY